jgi:hypothetical protein
LGVICWRRRQNYPLVQANAPDPPPAANGTIMLTDLFGKSCPQTGSIPQKIQVSVAASRKKSLMLAIASAYA